MKRKKIEAEPVDLIASGYEWVCPECDKLNKIIETAEQVICQFCNLQYDVADYNHATP